MYSFQIGDLVEVRQPFGEEECQYNLGLVISTRSPVANCEKYSILWLTNAGKYVKNWYEGGNLMLVSAREGNENRYAKYRAKE